MPGKSIGFVINCYVSALILVCGEQQVRCDNECAAISTAQTGQLSRCHTGNEDKNEIVKEKFLFCSIEGFRFPGFIKHNKLKFSSAFEFEDVLRVPGC